MIFDAEHVKIHGCFIVWDGITQPDTAQGKAKYSLKVVVPPSNGADLNDFNNLANLTLQTCPFKGVLPNGAGMPISYADASNFEGLYNGYIVLNCNTQRLPTVYDEMGKVLDPMQYGPMIYGGQQVDVLVHCYHYDKAGNKGIATGLDAFSIIVSANAIKQNFGGKGIDTSGAFGGQPGSGFAQQQAPAQQGGFQQQAPAQQGGFQQQSTAPQNNGQAYVDPNAAPAQGTFQAPAQQQGGFVDPNAGQQQGGFVDPNAGQQQAPAQQGGFVDPNAAPAQQGGFQQQAPAQQGGFQAPAQQGAGQQQQQSTTFLPQQQ